LRIAREVPPIGTAKRQKFLSLLERARSLAGRVAQW
jgi:hypothetical protein